MPRQAIRFTNHSGTGYGPYTCDQHGDHSGLYYRIPYVDTKDARLVATLYLRQCQRKGGGNVGHMQAALRLIEFDGDYADWLQAGEPLPTLIRGRLEEDT